MERWLSIFFVGAVCSLFLPISPTPYYVILFILVAIFFTYIKTLRVFNAFFFAIAWMIFNGASYQRIWLDNQLDSSAVFNGTHTVIGEIITLPSNEKIKSRFSQELTIKSRFNFEISQLDQVKLSKKITVRLTWDNAKHTLSQGQKWQLNIRLKPLHGFANKGGFSYQTWLRQKTINATGYVKNFPSNRIITNIASIRQKLNTQLTAILPDHELSPLIYALGFGDRSHLTPALWSILQSTGTQHLIAISGLHLGLVVSASYFLALLLVRLFPWKMLPEGNVRQQLSNANIRVVAIVFSCLVGLCYSYLAGFALPTVRALIMLLLFWFARLSRIKLSMKKWLLLALFIIVMLYPFSLFSASFWLSFYAVVVIFVIISKQSSTEQSPNKLKRWLKNLVTIQLGLTLLMLPIVAVYSYQLSSISFFANLIAVPWMSVTCIPLTLLAIVMLPISASLSEILLEISLQSLSVIWIWLSWLSSFQYSLIALSQKDVFMAGSLLILLILCWYIPKATRLFLFLIVSFIASFFILFKTDDNSQSWQVNVMDVGQGLAVVIEKNNAAILYDTGASYPSGFNLAESVLLPYLQYQGLSQLDKVIISHQDNDHAGGLPYLENQLVIDEIIQNKTVVKQVVLKAVGSKKRACISNESFIWQGLSFEILWPRTSLPAAKNSNDGSCVIRISDKDYSVLLTGDISAEVEKQLLQLKLIEPTDILVAPHHGSKSSSSKAFLQSVSPTTAVFSAGFNNRWNMPNKSVVQRYEKLSIKTFNTSTAGTVSIKVNNEGIEISEYRQDDWPFWFAN